MSWDARWLVLLAGCTSGGVSEETETSLQAIEPYDPLAWVDPFIATGGEGAEIANVNPGASMPFGMTLVGPDTRTTSGSPGFYHCAGYWWNDTHIWDFSHTHAHGMGVVDYGTVAFMPRPDWRDAYIEPKGRMAPFDHEEEEASPGSYRVVLGDSGTTVDIAATTHGAHTQVTWKGAESPTLVFDLGHALTGNEVSEANISFTPGSPTLRGFQQTDGAYSDRFGGLKHWFVAELDPAPVGGGAWSGSEVMHGETSAEGAGGGVWLAFPEGTTVVDIRLAISSVDEAGAAANLAAELPDADFEARVAEAETAWRDHLGRVRVRGGTDAEKTIFHTALYHASLMPSRQDDVDGRYRGLDQEIHTIDHPYYSDLSLWDTFRTLHPWYLMAWPEVQRDVARSLVRMTRDGGSLPRWPMAHGYTSGMVGTPAIQVLAETYLKGEDGFDVQAAFDASYLQATSPMPNAGRRAVERYVRDGYVAVEDGGGSVSRTLEFAWSDHALALWAESLGRSEADELWALSRNWQGVWDPSVGFFTGRCAETDNPDCGDNGFVWGDRSNAAVWWEDHFIEGNAWHYLWYVPYDMTAMIDVQHGGDVDAWHARYESYWRDAVFEEPNDLFPDDYYWHGNEPVMHGAFLGSLAGFPDITADASRWVMANRYAHDPVGLDGNDDAGTLSAWYLWAAIGWYPIAGTTQYAMGSPIFERVEIDRPGGVTWTQRAPGASDGTRYVTSLTLNGEETSLSSVSHDELLAGEVVWQLTDQPGTWGTDAP